MKHTDETVPVVMLTAIDLQEARVLADRVGADGYLTKPCDPEKLVQTIRDVAQKIWERRHTDQPKVEGRIRFTCRCGKRFRVKPIHRGKTLTCPECGEQIIVPRHD
jgi:DNA-binding response OmpR family regulator